MLYQLLRSHTLLILLTVGTGLSLAWLYLNRKRLNAEWWQLLLLAVLHTICGVLSVKAFAVMETLDLSLAGNMSLYGGVFFMPLLYLVGARLTRRSSATVCDVFTPCMIVTVMCARINCILSGCCGGKLIGWLSDARWPTRQAEVVFYIILLLLLCPRIINKKNFGTIYPIYMCAYGAFRFVIEWLREGDGVLGSIHVAHLWSVISFCLGLAIYGELCQREKINERKKKHG